MELKKNKGRLKTDELLYIQNNCILKTDEELSKELGRSLIAIRKARESFGVQKTRGGKVDTSNMVAESAIELQLQASEKLNEDQRKKFFQVQLTNSLYYGNLKEQFTKEEIDFYLEEWGTLCLQFEDIVATEKRQIDELIKVSIMGNRILRNIKVAEDEILNIKKEIRAFRTATPDLETNEEAQEKDGLLMNMIRTMAGQSHAMSSDYEKNINIKNQLLDELNARRKDRVDQLSRRGTTFLGLVQAFRDREVRTKHGEHMELVRMAKEKKKSDWRRPTTFPDGSKDCILLDEFSELPQQDLIFLEKERVSIIDHYAKERDKLILVVEDDFARCQLFAEMFKSNTIHYASSSDKAIESIKKNQYDLVCADFDLALGQTFMRVADFMHKNQVACEVLIHSENKEGADKLGKYLKKYNPVIQPFYKIKSNFIKDNQDGQANISGTENADNQSNV